MSRAFMNNVRRSLQAFKEETSNNIQHWCDSSDMSVHYLMIIGEKDTVYAHAPYFFKVTLPDEYPFVSPRCKFIGTVGTRLHPNLYDGGKVCLSILGTWSGEPWTPMMNLHTLAIQLQSLLSTDEPLTCEPGFKDLKDASKRKKAKEYREFLKVINFTKVIPKHYVTPPVNNREAHEYFYRILDEYKRNKQEDIIEHGKQVQSCCNGRTLVNFYDGVCCKIDSETLNSVVGKLFD